MKHVRPAAPPAPWLGGKKQLHQKIIQRIEAIPHKTYVEPFVGMGGVFLRRGWRPRLEVMNDLNGEIINLFRVIQQHYGYFMDLMRFQITSRREFEALRKQPPEGLTDLRRAARFLYLQRLAFGGQVGGVFGVAPTTGPRFSVSKMGIILDAVHDRLDGVVFENLSWEALIPRYDSPETLFYLDPPYWGGENDYGKQMFERKDYQHMADLLHELKGHFVLSINDVPEIREIFSNYNQEQVRLKYTASAGAATEARELIISDTAPKVDLFA